MTRSPAPPPPRGPSPKLETAFGIGFILVAIAMAVYADPGMGIGPWLAVVVVGGLGVDAVVAAARGRRSLLSRIGPLP